MVHTGDNLELDGTPDGGDEKKRKKGLDHNQRSKKKSRKRDLPKNNCSEIVVNPQTTYRVTLEVVSTHRCYLNLDARFCGMGQCKLEWVNKLSARSRILRNHVHLSKFHIQTNIISNRKIISSVFGEGRNTFNDFQRLCAFGTENIFVSNQSYSFGKIETLNERFTRLREILEMTNLNEEGKDQLNKMK